ncbi:MAG: 30S ribosomal protein S3 [Candidatus Moranbacteria bacterium GW2011_GWE1_49_15]|nr:MAG: 30S ribosomal protein S3 [Candidatus Moranbacteria bacterium GW2011_GWE2_47_10]KKW07447.1 MAG: 30S ribosomal protein S3 [Candidatus Moranbacteria bacterium GW2011_GWE1_49_15]HBP01465.1 30S ribosomal protein S3 [Candidatus Moranbacteria bacterium]
MGKKVNPTGLRLGITTTWKSKWFSARGYAKNLKQDVEIRDLVSKRWKTASIAEVGLERSANTIKVVIKTSRPGVLIGRGGTGIEDISKAIKEKFFANKKVDLKIEVQEVKQFEENAMLVAQSVAEQLEKRVAFRRILKSTLDTVEKNKNVKGVKIEVSGRLGGAEMSRREWLSRGTVPLHTLRADIDFARYTAFTTYGAIGVKVWIYKGEIFNK